MKVLFCLIVAWFVLGGIPAIASSEATITGRVVQQDGSPAPGITVVARSTQYVSPTPAGESVTDSKGRYTLSIDTGLAPGLFSGASPTDDHFTVSLMSPETKTFSVPSTQSVTLTGPPPSIAHDVNFILAIGPTITVHVHDAMTRKPIPGLTVKWGQFSPLNQTAGVTNAQGEVTFQVHPQNDFFDASSPLQIMAEVDPPSAAQPEIEAAPGYSFSRSFQLLPLQNVVWNIKTYHTGADNDPVTWYGVVLGPDGKPVPDAQVQIFRDWQNNPNLVTDASGDFWWTTQRIHDNEIYPYSQQLYITVSKGSLSTIQPLTPDETWNGIVVHLNATPPAVLSGTVVDPAGQPLAKVPVDINEFVSFTNVIVSVKQVTSMTDAQGHFQLNGLTINSSYTLRLGGWPQGPGSGDFGLVMVPAPSSNAIAVKAGERHDFGTIIVPHADGKISGQVVDTDGKPVTSNVSLDIEGTHTQVYAYPGKDGSFEADNVVSEPLTLTASVENSSKPPLAKLTVQANQKDLHIVIPAGSWEPPAPNPPTAPVGPPSVILGAGHFDFYGLNPQYDSQGNVTLLDTQNDIVWQGTLAGMNGMSLALNDNQGTLYGADGRALWTGVVWNIPELQIIADCPPESQSLQHVIVLNTRGKKIWSGMVNGPYYPDAKFTANTIMLKNSSRVVWKGHYQDGTVLYQFWKSQHMISLLNQFQNPQSEWDYSLPPFLSVPVRKGTVRFSLVSHHAELQDERGKVLWSGSISVFSLNYPKSIAAPEDLPLATVTNLIHRVNFVVYDHQDQPIPDLTVTYGPALPQ